MGRRALRPLNQYALHGLAVLSDHMESTMGEDKNNGHGGATREDCSGNQDGDGCEERKAKEEKESH